MKARVTVGLVVKNGADTIGRGMESLLAQSFTDFKIIISDNRSDDETPELCKEFARRDQRVKYIRQATDLGQIGNFWFVLGCADTEYFMWAAHDDHWEPDFIAKTVALLDAKPDVGLAATWVKVFDPANGDTRFSFKPRPMTSNFRMVRYLCEHLNPCVNKYYGMHRTKLLQAFDHQTFKILDYQDTLLIDYVNLKTKTDVVHEYLFNYAEEPDKVRTSLDPARHKIQGMFAGLNKFDHFGYVFNSLKLMRSVASNTLVQASVSLAFCAIFVGMKFVHRIRRR
ncbi:MAG: glycosyltransferase family 2 protein [Pseudomonadota bacterium]|nr:glycosyltransferase family 2 protein [Pseudomonadota bacterium]